MKNLKGFVAGFLCCAMLFGGVYAAEQYTATKVEYNVVVDGEVVKDWGDVPPVNVNGRTLLPLAKVGEILDVNVEWDGKQVVVGEVTPITTPVPIPTQEVKTVDNIEYKNSMVVDGLKIEISQLLDKNYYRKYKIRLTNISGSDISYDANLFCSNIGNIKTLDGELSSGILKPTQTTEGLLLFDNSQQITTDSIEVMYKKRTNKVRVMD